MNVVAAIREMLAKGLGIDQALDAAETFERLLTDERAQADEQRRAKAREGNKQRQRACRARHALSRVTAVTVTRDERDEADAVAPEAAPCEPPIAANSLKDNDNIIAMAAARDAASGHALSRVTAVTVTRDEPLARARSTQGEALVLDTRASSVLTPQSTLASQALTAPEGGDDRAKLKIAKTPRSVLIAGGISEDDADAIVAHRRAKKAPLTVRAAELLAKTLNATGEPHKACEMMIERGWQTCKPEWFDSERTSHGRNAKGNLVDAARELAERLGAERRERELRTGNGGADGGPALRVLPLFGR
jgi:hypothetical protein